MAGQTNKEIHYNTNTITMILIHKDNYTNTEKYSSPSHTRTHTHTHARTHAHTHAHCDNFHCRKTQTNMEIYIPLTKHKWWQITMIKFGFLQWRFYLCENSENIGPLVVFSLLMVIRMLTILMNMMQMAESVNKLKTYQTKLCFQFLDDIQLSFWLQILMLSNSVLGLKF